MGGLVAVGLLQLLVVYFYFGPSTEQATVLLERMPDKPGLHKAGAAPAKVPTRREPAKIQGEAAGALQIPRARRMVDANEASRYGNGEHQPVLSLEAPVSGPGSPKEAYADLRATATARSRPAMDYLAAAEVMEGTGEASGVRRLVKGTAAVRPVCLRNTLSHEPDNVVTAGDGIVSPLLEYSIFSATLGGYGYEISEWGMAEANKMRAGSKIIPYYRTRGQTVVYIDTGATLGLSLLSLYISPPLAAFL